MLVVDVSYLSVVGEGFSKFCVENKLGIGLDADVAIGFGVIEMSVTYQYRRGPCASTLNSFRITTSFVPRFLCRARAVAGTVLYVPYRIE